MVMNTPDQAERWRRVTRETPCAVCGKGSWCAVSVEDGNVYCMRVPSDKPVESGGWIHTVEAPLPMPSKGAKRLTATEVEALVNRMASHPRAESMRRGAAQLLGVSHGVLARLCVGCGLDDYRKTWFTSWPERNALGAFTGLVRRYEDGAKKTYPGTSHGLIFADDWRGDGKVVFVPEGGSDTAALLSLGLSAIGRPSNLGGVPILTKLLRGYRGAVVVLGECDQRPSPSCKDCGKCGLCWPGRFGAVETAARLSKHGIASWWALLPEAKDARAWIQGHPGASGEAFKAAVRSCVVRAGK